MLHRLNDVIYYLEERNKKIKNIFYELKGYGDLILFGGAIRDYILKKAPRDYDFVINTELNIENVFRDLSYKINRFGGYKLFIDDLVLDIWKLSDTWAFKNGFFSPKPENLPKTVFFNIESIAYNTSTQGIYEYKFLEALRTNTLDIVFRENPFKDLCVLRAIVYKIMYSMELSINLSSFISSWHHNTENPFDVLLEVQLAHYGSIILEKETICNVLVELELKKE